MTWSHSFWTLSRLYREPRHNCVRPEHTRWCLFFFPLFLTALWSLSSSSYNNRPIVWLSSSDVFFSLNFFFLFVCFSSLAFMKRHLELLLTFLILFNIYVYSINFHSFLHLSSLTDDTLLGRVLCTLWLLSFQREREKRRGKVWERGSIRVAAPWAWREYLQ